MFCFLPGREAKGRGRWKTPRPRFELTTELYSDRLLGAHRNRSQPSMAVALLAAHDGVELLLQCPGDRAHAALADLDPINRTDRRDLRGRAGEEYFVGDVKHLARNHLLND